MRTPTARSLETSNLRIHYFEFGTPAGVPVILLHGFPDSPSAYFPVVEQLSTKKARILVPYLRGFGPTEVKSRDLVGGQEAALGHDLLSFADALGLERFHLVGHDWGARTAYAASILAPDRLLTLMALSTPYVMYGGAGYTPAQVNADWYQWYFQMELGREMLRERGVAFCEQLWRSWSPEWKFSKSEFAEAAKAWSGPQFVDTVLHYYRTRWGGALSMRAYADLQAQLNADPKPKITVPTIYVQGGADACDLPAGSEEQAKWFSGRYERVLLKGLGHFPHRESPKAVAKILKSQIPELR